MKTENQFCTIGPAKQLAQLGVLQDSLFYHFPTDPTLIANGKPEYTLLSGDYYLPNQIQPIRPFVVQGIFENTYSAFSVAELFVMLPYKIVCEKMPAINELNVDYYFTTKCKFQFKTYEASTVNFADSLAEMLFF